MGVFGVTMSQEKEEIVRQIKLKFFMFSIAFFLRFSKFFKHTCILDVDLASNICIFAT